MPERPANAISVRDQAANSCTRRSPGDADRGPAQRLLVPWRGANGRASHPLHRLALASICCCGVHLLLRPSLFCHRSTPPKPPHAVQVLRVMDGDGKLLVAWLADTDPPNAVTDTQRARPAAPPTPAGWAANVKAGEVVDVYHDGAWWGVVLDARKGLRAKVRRATEGGDSGSCR